MKRGLSVAVLLLVVYLMVQNAECKNNRTQGHLFVDGIDVDKLTDGELYGLLDAEDEKFIGQLDIWIGKQVLKERKRIKRIPPVVVAVVTRVAWVAGRKIMKSLIKKTIPLIKKNSGKITKIYFKRGGYRSAKKDFKRFKPTNVGEIRKKNGQPIGYTGEILGGKYQITVRKTSSHFRKKIKGETIRPGRPTLEIRSKTGGKVIRKLRYENSRSYQANKKTYKYKSTKQPEVSHASRSRRWSGRTSRRKSASVSRHWSGRSSSHRSKYRSSFRRTKVGNRRFGSRFRSWSRGSAIRRSRSRSRSWSRGNASRRSGSRSRSWSGRSASRRSGSRSRSRSGGSASRRSGSSSGRRSWG